MIVNKQKSTIIYGKKVSIVKCCKPDFVRRTPKSSTGRSFIYPSRNPHRNEVRHTRNQ